MIETDANGSALTPSIVRAILAQIVLRRGVGEKMYTVKISKEQAIEWENNAIVVQRIDRIPSVPTSYKPMLGGYEMNIDHSIPKDVVLFFDENGIEFCRITNLKVPDWAVA